MMRRLPDRRAPGLPDLPYSAYCRVCWNPVYALWIAGDHGGACPEAAASAEACGDAMGRARLSAEVAKLRRAGLIR